MTTASYGVFNQAGAGLQAPPPVPSYSNVAHHPHGRSELRGDGVYTAYRCAWIPSVAAVPPVPPRPPRY